MTSGLRKAHKISWILIAVFGTIFLFFTIRGLNFDSQRIENREEAITSVQTKENKWIKLSQKGNQIQLIVKTPLKASSSVVYGIGANGERSKSLGQVSTVGIYVFYTDNPIQGIEIFDEIKEVELTKLKF